jgi:hypothetical protein
MTTVVIEALVKATRRKMDSSEGQREMKFAFMKGTTSTGAIIVCFGLATRIENLDIALKIAHEIERQALQTVASL